jgi:hypothetical protein
LLRFLWRFHKHIWLPVGFLNALAGYVEVFRLTLYLKQSSQIMAWLSPSKFVEQRLQAVVPGILVHDVLMEQHTERNDHHGGETNKHDLPGDFEGLELGVVGHTCSTSRLKAFSSATSRLR